MPWKQRSNSPSPGRGEQGRRPATRRLPAQTTVRRSGDTDGRSGVVARLAHGVRAVLLQAVAFVVATLLTLFPPPISLVHNSALPTLDHCDIGSETGSNGERGSFGSPSAVRRKQQQQQQEQQQQRPQQPQQQQQRQGRGRDRDRSGSGSGDCAARVKHGNRVLAVAARSHWRHWPVLSPEHPLCLADGARRKKTLVLDLDETLIHSSLKVHHKLDYDFLVEVYLDKSVCLFHVYRRPYVQLFLQTVARWYDLVVFTAGVKAYAQPVINFLDNGQGLFRGRYFRDSCVHTGSLFVKNLAMADPDLANVLIVDNSPGAYLNHQENAIPIEGWYDDQADECLLDLLPFLDALRFATDVRSVLGMRTRRWLP